MKIRYQSIVVPELGDIVQTRWGGDLVHIRITEIIGDTRVTNSIHAYECVGEIVCVEMDYDT
jgi:hypothetical protein